jgi:nitrile hydratase subunit beta
VNGRLSPGTPVRVKAIFPPGHVRTPHFLRGREGEVIEALGEFGDPEALAYGRRAERQTLYRVRFQQSKLWPDYAGMAEDTLVADLFEHWLEAPGGDVA